MSLLPVQMAEGEARRPKPVRRRSEANPEVGWCARSFAVEPGVYRLRTPLGADYREQTVYAFAGRRTVVFLKFAQMAMLRSTNKGLAQARVTGIDLAQTTVTSSPLDRPVDTDHQDVQLADILLHSLTWGGDPLPLSEAERLRGPQTGPFLKLYAAAHLVRGFEARESRAWRQEQTSDSAGGYRFAPQPDQQMIEIGDLKLAWDLLDELPGSKAEWPDALCIALQIEHLSQGRFQLSGPRQVSAPPMLSCAWRWLSTLSVQAPGLTQSHPALRCASRFPVDAGAWLAWRSPAAVLQTEPSTPDGDVDLVTAVNDLVRGIGDLTKGGEGREYSRRVDETLLQLSPSAQRIANSAVVTYQTISRLEGEAAPLDVTKLFTQSLGGMADTIAEDVAKTMTEFQAAKANLFDI